VTFVAEIAVLASNADLTDCPAMIADWLAFGDCCALLAPVADTLSEPVPETDPPALVVLVLLVPATPEVPAELVEPVPVAEPVIPVLPVLVLP
jgi:hypothetical protein